MIRPFGSLWGGIFLVWMLTVLLRQPADVYSDNHVSFTAQSPLQAWPESLGKPLDRLEKEVLFQWDEDITQQKCFVQRTQQALIIDLPWHALFKKPDLQLHAFAVQRLEKIAALLRGQAVVMQIEIYAQPQTDIMLLHRALAECMQELYMLRVDMRCLVGMSAVWMPTDPSPDSSVNDDLMLRLRILPHQVSVLASEKPLHSQTQDEEPSVEPHKKNGVRYTILKERR